MVNSPDINATLTIASFTHLYFIPMQLWSRMLRTVEGLRKRLLWAWVAPIAIGLFGAFATKVYISSNTACSSNSTGRQEQLR